MLNDIEISSYIKDGKLIGENYDPDCLTPNGYEEYDYTHQKYGNLIIWHMECQRKGE